ncbi:2-deoxy-D-gluconate 3-dehydrogenase [Deinococcus aerius]|uniref:2-deoxy-D-gluconate 3-dehydrogenase n=1 Tax=Deinococcus aerius TaxID=200253 RepID=A0A2I9DII9_9DEIO|nr:2-dehydro-3-deoxy-D-gluconate 5-dehydrogenase KduD [Deinococcus aerius]GBF06078.1 2-deoxy-D-gluconate 3-dehydrogenase [Deinococcus aerius]
MTSPFSLEGRVALVTGGAGGIGQAVALGLAQAGADVAVVVHSGTAETTGAGVERAGRRFLSVQADLAGPATVAPLVAEVEAGLGPIDILVNNAGIIRRQDAAEYPEEDWRAVLDVNLNAVWHLSQAVGRSMLARGRGKIINVASLLSFQGGVRVPAYAASKHAVAGLTKALANEWAARGVNVNAIAPGYIETGNTSALRADPERSRQILERIPAGRWGSPADLAGAAVFLASGASDYVHGHVLVVDGGWLAR